MEIDLSLYNNVFLTNQYDCALQELDMIFGTENTELIGNPEYGTTFEQFLWDMVPSIQEIKQYINRKIINTFYMKQLQYDIRVECIQGDYENVYVIFIDIALPGRVKTKKYVYK